MTVLTLGIKLQLMLKYDLFDNQFVSEEIFKIKKNIQNKDDRAQFKDHYRPKMF